MSQLFDTKYVSFSLTQNVSILTQKMCQFFSSLNLTQKYVNISNFEIFDKIMCQKLNFKF